MSSIVVVFDREIFVIVALLASPHLVNYEWENIISRGRHDNNLGNELISLNVNKLR